MPESYATCLHAFKYVTHARHPKALDYGGKNTACRFIRSLRPLA